MEENVAYKGLTDAQVLESRAANGANVLTEAKKNPWWREFLAKFRDPLIIILLVAGVLSIGIAVYEYVGLHQGGTVFFEPVGIFIAILLATGLGFYFEYRANKEFAILNQVNDDEPVQVIRNGSATSVPKRDVVVGDILVLNTGEEIPADAELLEAMSMNVDESTLTGEPMAHKTTDPQQFDAEATFPSNHVLRGTRVMEGHGVARVLAVGDHTENGKVFEATRIDDNVTTPLTEQLDRLGKLIAKISYVVAAIIIVGRVSMWFVHNPQFELMPFLTNLLQSFMIAVTLVVVSVPEGLPMAVTLSLAYSMRRMLKTNNLVRKLHACETMGATTVICTDKTGTLTQNRMQVHDTNFYGLPDGRLTGDEESRLVADGIAVNSTAQLDFSNPEKPEVLGNPTEGALLLWLNSQGVDYRKIRQEYREVAELPFSTERKFMATLVERKSDGKRLLFVKGAPEIVYGLCRNYPEGATRENVDASLLAYQQQAMRTLGFAWQEVAAGAMPIDGTTLDASSLTFLGFVAISDPVRADVPAAIEEVLDAGIAVKIVTGDTVGTAKEIGRQIGLWKPEDTDRNIITGPEFGQLTEAELDDRVMDLKIIARARPMDKKRLVEALQRQGQVVAVTGDGTNDAPALKAAHVGLSMGDGTSVAKEASDITIVDNSFASIGRAVMWGRSLYRNIQRFVMFQMTVNVAACLIVMAGAFMGTESPLTVTQMLWVNLIMDTFAAMALASLPPSESVMHAKPRSRQAFIITRTMWRNIIVCGLLFFGVMFYLVYAFEHGNITALPQLLSEHFGAESGLTTYELSLVFTIFVMLQFWNLFNARAYATRRSALHLGGCGEFLFIAAVILVGQIFIVTVGGPFFSVTPLRITDWLWIIGGTSLVLWIGELTRIFKNKGRE